MAKRDCKQCGVSFQTQWRGQQLYCSKSCGQAKRKEDRRLAAIVYYRNNTDAVRVISRKHHLLTKFGLTIQDYEYILAKQGGGCGICRGASTNGRSFDVDHDHTTGAVRGLLCNRCNTGIGNFKDSPQLLSIAIAYLGVANVNHKLRLVGELAA